MNTVTLSTGSSVSFPFPPPMTLDVDNPSVLAVSADRNGAYVKATSAGMAWLTIGFAADLQLRIQVTVADLASSANVAKPAATPAHR
jgi:hypothetical protein